MIEVIVCMIHTPIHTPGATTGHLMSGEVVRETQFLAPENIDRIIGIDPAGGGTDYVVPAACKSRIRYKDDVSGYVYLFCETHARTIARDRTKYMLGIDPMEPDFSEIFEDEEPDE
tara:strand:- start:497 stop:844 length:348 start_codon:yes stop_codon:yes gene_type:complete